MDRRPTRTLTALFLITDSGFVLYWLVTVLRLIPKPLLFKDYHEPILVAWNWSFLPLDLCISASGYLSLYRARRADPAWEQWAIVSLVLTFCSGLQAIAFWTLRSDFDVSWWTPNLYLLVYPLFFLPTLVRARAT